MYHSGPFFICTALVRHARLLVLAPVVPVFLVVVPVVFLVVSVVLLIVVIVAIFLVSVLFVVFFHGITSYTFNIGKIS